MTLSSRTGIRRGLALALLPLLVVAPSKGQEPQVDESGTGEGVRVLALETSVRMDDGKLVEHRQRYVGEVLDAAGLASLSQLLVFFHEETGEAELERLELRKPDGTVRELLDDAPQDVVSVLPPGLPIYSDFRALRTAVPALEIGDMLTFVSRTSARPVTRKDLWFEYEFSDPEAVDAESLVLDLAEGSGLRVRFDEESVELVEERREDGRWIRTWRRKKSPPLEEKREDPPYRADVEVSSFAGWQEIGAWWSELGARQTPGAVREKAKELTAGLETPRARLDAIHRFVAQEIRYLGLPLGIGRYQPRPPEDVLRTGFGDCKDKSRLLADLASSVGVRVDSVLIHANGRELDEEFASPVQFDHVVSVAEVSGEAVWMDATSEMTPSGALPAQLRGVRALRVSSTGLSSVVTTPEELPFESSVASETVGSIGPDGTIRARVRWVFRGDDEVVRLAFKYGNPELWQQAVMPMHRHWKSSQTEIGEITFGDPEDLATPFWVDVEVTWKMGAEVWAKDWELWLPTPALTFGTAPDPPSEDVGIDGMPEALDLESTRRQTVTARLELPEGSRAAPPVPVEVDRPFAMYRSDYRFEDGAMVVERELVRRADSVDPESFDALRGFHSVLSDDRRQKFRVGARADFAPEPVATADSLGEAGFEAIEAGRIDEAIDLLQRAVELDKNHRYAWNNLGRALMRAGRREEARAALERQIEINPSDAWAYSNLGMLEWELGHMEEAERLLRRQIDLAPLEPYAMKKLGRRLAQKGEVEEAERWLRRAFRLDSEDSETIGLLIWVLIGRDRVEEAGELAMKHPAAPSDLVDRATVAYSLVASDGGDWTSFGPWAEALVDEAEKALAAYSGAEPKVPEVAAAVSLGLGWEILGRLALDAGRPHEAEPLLAGAFRLRPIPPTAARLSEALREIGEAARADLYLATAVVLDAEGRRRFGPLLSERIPDRAYRSQLESRATEATWQLRSLEEEAPEAASGEGRLWFVYGPDGRLERVLPGRDETLVPLVERLGARGLSLDLPAGNRARIPQRGYAHCSANGACTVVFESLLDTWWDLSGEG